MNNYLGIDPGTHRMGWAVVTASAHKPILVQSGCLELPPHAPSSLYLPAIYQQLQALVREYEPLSAGLEQLFAQHNAKTVISVAEARGVIQLALAEAHIPIYAYSPNTVKATVAGNGSATKAEVTRMVGLLVGVDPTGLLDDETDAISIALTTQILCKHT